MQKQLPHEIQNLKMVNKKILENEQIMKILPKIQTLSQFITKYKLTHPPNIPHIIHSSQYLDLLESIKALNINFDLKIGPKSIFPTNNIYSNMFFQREKMFCFGLIIIPKGLEFQLHDHCQMFIMTKVLQGQLLVQDMDFDHQYLKVVKFLRGKLQERRKNKFFAKRLPMSSILLMEKKESSNSNPDTQDYTEQFYENCLRSKTYENFDNMDCYKIKNWKTHTFKNPEVKALTPVNHNIHRYVALTDCILLNLFLCDNCDQFKFRFYEYHQDFDQDYPFIFRTGFCRKDLNFIDINDII